MFRTIAGKSSLTCKFKRSVRHQMIVGKTRLPRYVCGDFGCNFWCEAAGNHGGVCLANHKEPLECICKCYKKTKNFDMMRRYGMDISERNKYSE